VLRRRLLPGRDVGQAHGRAGLVDVVAVEAPEQVAVDRGELVTLGVVERVEVGHVAVRGEVHLDRPAGGEGHV
jgi:hypothetical protein